MGQVPNGAPVAGTAGRCRSKEAAATFGDRIAPRSGSIQSARKAVGSFYGKAAMAVRSQDKNRSKRIVSAKTSRTVEIAAAVQQHSIRKGPVATTFEVVNHRFTPRASRPRHLVRGSAGGIVS